MAMQAVATMSNQHALCVCEITTKEACDAMNDDPAFDGFGLYLVRVDKHQPSAPAKVLAKFISEEAAGVVARFFSVQGHLEPA